MKISVWRLGSLLLMKWATILACSMMGIEFAAEPSAKQRKSLNLWRLKLIPVLIPSLGQVVVGSRLPTFLIRVLVRACWIIQCRRRDLKLCDKLLSLEISCYKTSSKQTITLRPPYSLNRRWGRE